MEGMQLEKGKKTTKAGLINKGRLQAAGFLTGCSLICCSVRGTQGFVLTASVNPVGCGFTLRRDAALHHTDTTDMNNVKNTDNRKCAT